MHAVYEQKYSLLYLETLHTHEVRPVCMYGRLIPSISLSHVISDNVNQILSFTCMVMLQQNHVRPELH